MSRTISTARRSLISNSAASGNPRSENTFPELTSMTRVPSHHPRLATKYFWTILRPVSTSPSRMHFAASASSASRKVESRRSRSRTSGSKRGVSTNGALMCTGNIEPTRFRVHSRGTGQAMGDLDCRQTTTVGARSNRRKSGLLLARLRRCGAFPNDRSTPASSRAALVIAA